MSARKFRGKNVVEKYDIILPSKRNFSMTLAGDSDSGDDLLLPQSQNKKESPKKPTEANDSSVQEIGANQFIETIQVETVESIDENVMVVESQVNIYFNF